MLRVLFAAFKHDPLLREREAGADFHFLKALKDNGVDVHVVGPFNTPPVLAERIIRRVYTHISKRQYLKYNLSRTIEASIKIQRAACELKPDLIFTLYPPPLVFYRGKVPCVFRTDATFKGVRRYGEEFYPYGRMASRMNIWLEQRALDHCSGFLTHSEWAKHSLIEDYGVPAEKVCVLPNSCYFPDGQATLKTNFLEKKKLNGTLRLLFVGRDARRKGLDVAIDTVNKLNRIDIAATLTVCGVNGVSDDTITYAGNLDKRDAVQYSRYLSFLEEAHFLLHPARFDPSPRVTSEAAAFGTPTITNNVGGIATSVQDGDSGIVLPKGSAAEIYASAIKELVSRPDLYYDLCKKTNLRYKRELNIAVTGKRLVQFLEETVNG
ncbi:MAG: glycosyltransferase family 4 protein [Anaerolineales bacterium]|nr:glycosyltransferase family 4 protein [Anaerolineales bacterium]